MKCNDDTKLRYITAGSALNIPDPDGNVADWHTEGMLRSGKLVVAGDNFTAAPGLLPTDLRDVSDFIRRRGLEWSIHHCATPERAVLDMIYHAVFIRGAVPASILLDDLLVEIDLENLKHRIQPWLDQANPAQQQHLQQWIQANEIG